MRRMKRFAMLIVASLLFAVPSASAGVWTRLTNNAPGSPGTMLLLSDGSVMVQGGSGSSWYRLKPDIHGGYVNGT